MGRSDSKMHLPEDSREPRGQAEGREGHQNGLGSYLNTQRCSRIHTFPLLPLSFQHSKGEQLT